MKRIWMPFVVLMGIAGVIVASNFFSASKVVALPVVMEDVQYPFEKGGGIVNVAVEDIFMGVGMLTGEKRKEDARVTLTGSVNFELASKKAKARLEVDRIQLIERTATGEKGRVLEADRIYDGAMEKGLEPELKFLKEKGQLPFVWEDAERDCVFFVFKDVPSDLTRADLVLTYNGVFPGKKHRAYYEDRLSVTRKSYLRNR